MIYELERCKYDDYIVSDNLKVYLTDSVYINTKNILSIERYEEANRDIYGLRINGIKYPLLASINIVYEIYYAEEDNKKRKFYERIKDEGRKLDLTELSEEEKDMYNDFDTLYWDKFNDYAIYIDNTLKNIVEIMKTEQ